MNLIEKITGMFKKEENPENPMYKIRNLYLTPIYKINLVPRYGRVDADINIIQDIAIVYRTRESQFLHVRSGEIMKPVDLGEWEDFVIDEMPSPFRLNFVEFMQEHNLGINTKIDKKLVIALEKEVNKKLKEYENGSINENEKSSN